MTFKYFHLVFLSFLLAASPLPALLDLFSGPYQVYTGPEVYHVTRIRGKGVEQRGLLVGEHSGFEHIVPHTVYLGLDGYYATGTLRGHNSINLDMDSTLREAEVEGRAGFTVHTRYCPFLLLAPYLGYGHFYSKNHILPPYPLPVTLHDDFSYLSAGFKTRIILSQGFTIGIDFKIKVPFQTNSKVTGYPDQPDTILHMGEEEQYEAELPIQFDFCWGGWPLGLELVPFYRYRHFGGREDFPFNFVETRFHILGVRATLSANF